MWQKLRIAIITLSPHEIAAGVAAGVFGALLPIYGVQMLTSAAVVKLIKGNLWVAMLASWIGNPITYPFFWWLQWLVGMRFIEGKWTQHLLPNFQEVFEYKTLDSVWHIIKPILWGFPIIGTGFAIIFYVATYWYVILLRKHIK